MLERERETLARISWLQSLVSHRIVPVTFAKHLYKRCCSIVQLPYDDASYRAMFDEASKRLSQLDLEMRTFRDQSSGQPMLALVNTKAADLIQGATRYSALDISFIKRLVEEIFKARKEAYAVPALEAVRLGSKLRTHMTRDATEELLKNLVDHRWIDYSAEGIYTLSTRSLLELRNYLQNEFGDDYYHNCTHCKDLVTLGVGCSYASRGCSVRYHLHCARNTIGSAVDDDDALHRLAGFSCPGCQRTWKSRPIGPRALNLTLSGEGDAPFSSQGSTVDRKRRQVTDDDDDEDDDGDDHDAVERQLSYAHERDDHEGEEEDAEQPQRRSRRVKPEPEASHSVQRPSCPSHGSAESNEDQDVKPRKRAR